MVTINLTDEDTTLVAVAVLVMSARDVSKRDEYLRIGGIIREAYVKG